MGDPFRLCWSWGVLSTGGARTSLVRVLGSAQPLGVYRSGYLATSQVTAKGTGRETRRGSACAVPQRDGAVIGIDLAEDSQAIAMIDHDVRVLARRTVRVTVFRLGPALTGRWRRPRAEEFERLLTLVSD
jgi:hypothetical protein